MRAFYIHIKTLQIGWNCFFFMKKAFVGFCHFVCLVQSFLLTFPQWKKYRMKWKWMYVCRMCNMFFMYKIFTLFFNQRWDSSVKYWLLSIIIYLISSSKDMTKKVKNSADEKHHWLCHIYTGCPTFKYSLCFGCFRSFLCFYRGFFYHLSIWTWSFFDIGRKVRWVLENSSPGLLNSGIK